jgi:hypothetical protein
MALLRRPPAAAQDYLAGTEAMAVPDGLPSANQIEHDGLIDWL